MNQSGKVTTMHGYLLQAPVPNAADFNEILAKIAVSVENTEAGARKRLNKASVEWNTGLN